VAKVAALAMTEIQTAIESTAPGERLVLAVSGGRDSMVLLDAFARLRPDAIAAVATFDHGTGAFARSAVEVVRQFTAQITAPRGITFVHGAASDLPPTEAAWRGARWRFLRETAARFDARVATAHTRDDQVETVFIRVLRDSGPRGLAGLLADGDIVRPLVRLPRAFNAEYAEARSVLGASRTP
jgi:tRNA(Ile)-lysidine synthase